MRGPFSGLQIHSVLPCPHVVEKEVISLFPIEALFSFMTLSPKSLQAPSHGGFDFTIGILVEHKYSVFSRSPERQEERVGGLWRSLWR